MLKEKSVDIIRASEIEPKEVRWLWYPYIPYGKVTLIQGDPGDGKSTFVLNLAALLTTDRPLPFTEEAREPITVISKLKGGLIVAIKDGRYNIDKPLAEAITV